ncbi:helix-turn-helix domain-containing protein [Gandjariella thermophila]|uniref:Transcriptional regulator n=1 Tax=Gandjariella thermophila TaxID=1931992 RepID=A0A4D4J7X3_9PSEU|nr:helix-turn-helix transcriptional regulator [Gandjariella thermophila]GDY31302.1 transcriptional regulator [Gandjariella thermophila]
MAEPFSPIVPRLRLARELKRLREIARLSLDHAAKELDVSTATLSRIENGKQGVNVHLVRSMLDLYNGSDCWNELLDLARQARRKGWWQEYGISDYGYVALETDAAVVRDFQLTLVPGLLQTSAYARAVFEAEGDVPSRDIGRHVDVRMLRQGRLHADEPLVLEAVVHEHALRSLVGGAVAMREQLLNISELAALPNVTLHVLPAAAGAHVSMQGAFTVLSFPRDVLPDRLYIAHSTGALHIEKVDQVRAARLKFDRLRGCALDPDASIRFVRQVAGEL